MSHEKRMHMIDEQGAGGFALEEGHKLDSNAVEKIQETVDVSEIVAKYDKESVYRSFKGWLDIFIKILCIAFSAFHLYTAATTPFAPQIQRGAPGLCADPDLSAVSCPRHGQHEQAGLV